MDCENQFHCFEPIRNDRALLAVNAEATISVVDMNAGKIEFDWQLPSQQAPSHIKNLIVGEDSMWAITGSSTGEICLLDQRSGFILDTWKAHDSNITKVSIS